MSLKKNLDNAFILKFLRASEYNTDKTKRRIACYNMMKIANPEWFANTDILQPVLKNILELGVFIPLGYDDFGRRVLLTRSGLIHYTGYTMNNFLKLYFLVLEYLLLDEQTQIRGIVEISDMSHGTQSDGEISNQMMTFSNYCQNAFPVKWEGLHVIYHQPTFETLLPIIKLFLPQKMSSNITLHGNNLVSLHSCFPVTILSTEYGGRGASLVIKLSNFIQDMIICRGYLLNL
ncbi:hypothetical protein CHUAL_009870 [Chamberlinius hualienensis]